MFQSTELVTHLNTSHTIRTETAVYFEWNMNDPDNIQRLGNYRYRPYESGNIYQLLPSSYDPVDSGNYYTGATDADIIVQGGVDETGSPTLFTAPKDKTNLYYSLEDCVKPHRPRSGINKLLYLGTGQYIDAVTKNIARRPRYYVSSRDDQFKYWSSFRTQTDGTDNFEYGISRANTNGLNIIKDTAPFVVYSSTVPTNKVVVKMQTNVGDIDLGPFRYGSDSVADPFYGDENRTVPLRWRIEALRGNQWTTLKSFDELSVDADGNTLIGHDGYVEISYGLQIPDAYKDIFVFADTITDVLLLPDTAVNGYSYLVQANDGDLGTMHIYVNDAWESFIPSYGWFTSSDVINFNSAFVTQHVDPPFFNDISNNKVFREFDLIDGLRIAVETMNKDNCTFDLIEMSPRLLVDMTEKVISVEINKMMSDLGNNSLPVSNLLASTGSIVLFDDDLSFNSNNAFDRTDGTGSVIAAYTSKQTKVLTYDIVKSVGAYDYFIPVKTLYTEGFPQTTDKSTTITLTARDKFFYLENSPAPQMLMTNVSLSYAVSLLLDFIGVSNYDFYRVDGESEIVIPYFFVAPNQNCAEILQQLAVASQSAMFFDEYNNFIVMSKGYLMPSETDRATDAVLYGQENGENLPNIINPSSMEKKVYNNGQIDYTTRYIQRSIGSQNSAYKIDQYKEYIYKPVLLWEVAPQEARQTINELGAQSGGYTLSAVPLNTDITISLPYASNNKIFNNIIDVGEAAYWVSSFQGYFYANGEIIRYDAMEYSVQNEALPVWITSNQEYQDYMSRLSFNGKMYPTGNIRIWTEPQYVTVSGETRILDGAITNHGRGQFGTTVTGHVAGLTSDNYWTNNDYVRGCIQNTSDYLFSTSDYIAYPTLVNAAAGKAAAQTITTTPDVFSQSSTRNGIMKNFMAQTYNTESEINHFRSANAGTLQSSALIFNGPSIPDGTRPADFVSYVYKELTPPYKHFGTRMRIIGKIESGTTKSQTPVGAYPIYSGGTGTTDTTATPISAISPSQDVKVYGGSGGLAFGLNKDTNVGYYFEIVSLTADNIADYANSNSSNIASATILSSPAPSCVSNVVTVYTQNQIDFQVGQKVRIFGLINAAAPLDTSTPLNGEWPITAVGTDKKSFQYTITGGPLTTTSTTGGTAVIDLGGSANISNIIFYKVMADASGNAITYKLWSGLSQINVDDGNFTGQYRFTGEQNPTVYDLAAEYVNIGASRRFYLYINEKQIATVDDTSPLPEYNNVALFVRGSSRIMFENIYALANSFSSNTTFAVADGISKVFSDEDITATESFRKYAMSGIIQQTYLSSISSGGPPVYKLYFEEFGTIMRECAYLNIKYDKAYPALYSKVMKTFNRMKGYSVSGFYGGSYGADFLLFNCTDSNLNLDDTTGNYLRIMGVAFTQDTTYTLTVDDYFSKVASMSNPTVGKDGTLVNPYKELQQYNSIKNSRMKYGNNEFTISSPYIQTSDTAENIFGWVIDKVSVPRIAVGVDTFATQHLQLGDIVTFDYESNGVDVIAPPTTRFVIYNMSYQKSTEGLSTVLYMVEV